MTQLFRLTLQQLATTLQLHLSADVSLSDSFKSYPSGKKIVTQTNTVCLIALQTLLSYGRQPPALLIFYTYCLSYLIKLCLSHYLLSTWIYYYNAASVSFYSCVKYLLPQLQLTHLAVAEHTVTQARCQSYFDSHLFPVAVSV